MKKTNLRKFILSLIAITSLTTAVFAGEFNLNSIKASDLEFSQEDLQAIPIPARPKLADADKAPNIPDPALDMAVKLPFRILTERLADLPGIKIQPIDPAAPVLFRKADNIAFSNVTVNYNGLEVEPTILVRPFFEGKNRLAIKVVKIDADIVFGPKTSGVRLDKDGLMEMVMANLTSGILEAMDKAFLANNVPLHAKDVLAFSYDRPSWTLRAAINPGFVAPLLPGLIDNIDLTAFSFDDTGFALSVKSGSAASLAQLPGYNLAVSDGLLDRFILKYTKDTDFELHPKGHEGGLKFRADGRLELAGKIYAKDVFIKPNVYFKAEVTPALVSENTITLRFEKVTVDQAYGIGIPGFVSSWLQGTIIAGVIKTITTNPALAKEISVRKIDDKTVELTLKNSAFLPSFAKGAAINKLKIGNGLMFLGFKL